MPVQPSKKQQQRPYGSVTTDHCKLLTSVTCQ
uniref:Uncharacterized protein n=1 Tax=Arundo donax TaxID=35708 RepID=A0A0A9GEV7_ARUDO